MEKPKKCGGKKGNGFSTSDKIRVIFEVILIATITSIVSQTVSYHFSQKYFILGFVLSIDDIILIAMIPVLTFYIAERWNVLRNN